MWMEKTATNRAETTRQKVTGWLQNDVFPYIGKAAVSTLKPRDVLACVQRMEARGVHESAHRVKQIIGQVLRFAVATGLAEPDVTPDLKRAFTIPAKLSALLLVRPGELRAAEWREMDLDDSVWRIPAAKIKMRHDHARLFCPMSSRAMRVSSVSTAIACAIGSSIDAS
ncbi:tyrosine-type recombinase/integrase [Massilia psychrophila]|uniref:Phage integrase central domain-containing protein n=1 Tax=Massilia psychrophila TaxID=1603353 RepID=A0A2G8SYU7_9BURK|nr:hypothetical protein [Massilia psychrophila]PIL38969.1 hypothetical protein CR103_14900 [Massilia psychrophila]GGE88752.1 hypothetical protein GCM10008020_37270 [Massilia psychrophila]